MRIDNDIQPAMIVRQNTDALEKEAAASGKTGDIVSISGKAKELAKARQKNMDGALQNVGQDEEGDKSSSELRMEQIEKRIKELQQKIRELQQSDLPEKQKQQQLAALQQELTTLQQELGELKNGGGGASGMISGTPAQGFANSLT
ncbi:hypothetical protein [Oceanidesulfovibrio marinus]|uniref:FlxA-like protein n=1 Tax=Oceanidesulfovibrio marinus TaxID=370038 RepID=A0A6P1ZFK9_9BACT|nr:hypothetical protein [Oceanidesulfovibrio marinus]QJT09359.1 hypothetical protein E8L03_10585 [Oceanidesulfovibrio marinus]TVM32851.1 hypothetical protein DQK91_14185 [Oceanidesulfovibrio marinus]